MSEITKVTYNMVECTECEHVFDLRIKEQWEDYFSSHESECQLPKKETN